MMTFTLTAEASAPFLAPNVGSFKAPASASLGVVVEGSHTPLPSRTIGRLPLVNRAVNESPFIDVFNGGTKAMPWTATPDNAWITLSQTRGNADDRILVGIDWDHAPRGSEVAGTITINGAGSTRAVIVRIFYPLSLDLSVITGPAGDNGVVTIEAENFTDKHDRADGTAWRRIDRAAASRDGMSVPPVGAPGLDPGNLPADTPSLTNQFYTFRTGDTKVRIECLPTHRITSDNPGLRYAISLNGETLKIRMIDPGMVLDKFVIQIQSGFFEAEDLNFEASSKPAVIFTDGPASGGAGLHLRSTAANDFTTLKAPDIPAGDYQWNVRVKKWTSRGIMQIAVAENPAGS